MTLTTSRAKAQRARENRAHVRVLLWKRQPAFAAALAAAEQDLSCPACQCRQREMIAHRLSKLSKALEIGPEAGQPARVTGAVSRPWEVSDERSRRLLLLVRQMAGAPVLQGNLPPVLRIPACGLARSSLTFKAACWCQEVSRERSACLLISAPLRLSACASRNSSASPEPPSWVASSM